MAEEALKSLASALRVSARTVSWFGEAAIRLPTKLTSEAQGQNLINSRLRELLYANFYSIGCPMLLGTRKALRTMAASDSLLDALHRANPTRSRNEHGWSFVGKVADGPLGALLVKKGGLTVTVESNRLIDESVEGLTPGTSVLVSSPAGRLYLSPGYYVAHSRVDMNYDVPISRFYLNVSPSEAPGLLREVCERLNSESVGFDLKVASEASLYFRADVAVLYICRADIAAARPVFRALASARILRPRIPVFTLSIAPGLGVADDPGGGESFGLHRCRLLADALSVTDNRAGRAGLQLRFDRMRAAFVDAGLSLERPHLNPGAMGDPYENLQ